MRASQNLGASEVLGTNHGSIASVPISTEEGNSGPVLVARNVWTCTWPILREMIAYYSNTFRKAFKAYSFPCLYGIRKSFITSGDGEH